MRPGATAAALGIIMGAAAPFLAAEPTDAPGEPGSAGASVFAGRCAVCHGPQAAGIPGSFPPLREQVVAFAKIPQGRDYLVMVVTSGLMGNLTVGAINYNGVMPAQSGLSEAEVAAVLNYLAAAAMSATDVIEARGRHADNSAQATRALRPAAVP